MPELKKSKSQYVKSQDQFGFLDSKEDIKTPKKKPALLENLRLHLSPTVIEPKTPKLTRKLSKKEKEFQEVLKKNKASPVLHKIQSSPSTSSTNLGFTPF